MSAFLRRASLRYVNQTSIPTLVKRLEQGLDATGHMHLSAQHARTWLSFISKHCPLLYKAHVGELHKAIADEENIVLAEVCLQALSALVRSDPKLGVWDKFVHP
jgi:sister-chromatid-cohesion protein PDS5